MDDLEFNLTKTIQYVHILLYVFFLQIKINEITSITYRRYVLK